MKKVFECLKPYIPFMLLGILFTFGQAMCNLYLPNLMSDIVNNGIVGQDLNEVYRYGMYMLLVTLGFMLCAIISVFIASRVSSGFGAKLRKSIYSKVQSYSLHEYKKMSTSSLITRTTNDVMQVQQLTLMSMRMMINAPIMSIGGIIMAVSKNLKLSLLFVVVIPILFVIILMLAKKILPLFTALQTKTDRLNQVIREKLNGVRVIRAFGTGEYERKRYDMANKDIYDVSLKAGYKMAILMPLVMFVINFSSVMLVWSGSSLIDQNLIQIGDMMAFMQYAIQVLFSILAVTMLFVMIPRAIVSIKRINEVLELESSVKDSGKDITYDDIKEKGKIEFIDATFQYADGDEPVLSDMNFTINKGETVAILGVTGSGKTTLLNLIMRFYDTTGGKIKIGGKDIKDIPIHVLRDMIGYVPQKAVLFSGTIKENIKYGKEDATDEEVKEAATIAQSIDFINETEGKFDAKVAQGGTNFSGGQKQRLSIARAIVKKPDIYLFDDSFSALDFQTDQKLREALNKNVKGATVIIVAQRVSTVLNADKILFLENGKIIAQGAHKELFENCKSYRDVVLSQITEEEAIENAR